MATEIGTDIFGTISNGTGMSNQSHLVYAKNADRWIFFYISSSVVTKVQAFISSSGDLSTATWSACTASPVFPNARTCQADARIFGDAIADISANDVIHLGIGVLNNFDDEIRATVVSNDLSWGSWSELSGQTANNPVANVIAFSGAASPRITEAGTMLTTGQDAQVRISNNGDAGSSWTAGFGGIVTIDSSMAQQCNSYFITPIDTTGKMVAIYGNGAAATTISALRYNKMVTANTWPTTGSAAAISTLTTVDDNDWAGCRVDDTHIFALVRTSSASGAWSFSLYNGNATWTAKTAPATQQSKNSSGVHLATDGTDIYAFIVDNGAANAIMYNKYTVATNTWGGWTTLEASTQTRNFISGYKLAGNNQIGIVYTETNGSNFKAMVTVLSLAAAPTVIPNQIVNINQAVQRAASY